MARRGRHSPHLPVLPLEYRQFDPRRRDVLPEPDRNGPGREIRIRVEESYRGRPEWVSVEDESPPGKSPERRCVRNSFHLDKIRAGMSEDRFQEPPREGPVVRQDEKAFAVGVEPADRIDIRRKRAEIAQRAVLPRVRPGRELRQDAEGFVEDESHRLMHWSNVRPARHGGKSGG